LVEVFGGGQGYDVRTEAELHAAVDSAFADQSGPSIIHLRLSHDDRSPSLDRMAKRLSQRV
jgi:thiamine pyrophosphate-dependent acetolactate synthase large subunit-like protein